ncbi:MAG: hypothetical protein AAB250_04315, partial [Bdellovibrionota bacterium]
TGRVYRGFDILCESEGESLYPEGGGLLDHVGINNGVLSDQISAKSCATVAFRQKKDVNIF